jgi:hypothetical protein
MKYLCLGYHETSAWRTMSDGDRSALLKACAAYEELLSQRGHRVEGRAFNGSGEAIRLRFENGKVSVAGGPFADTKQELGGIIVLDARDLNHAIQLMSQSPCMRPGGYVEIRSIIEDR